MLLWMIHWDTKRISTHIWILFPSSGTVPLAPLYSYFRCSRMRDREEYRISLIFSYVWPYLWKLLGLHREEKTTDIFPRMLESQMIPGSLWHQSRHLKEFCISMHIAGPDATTSDVPVSLSLPRQVCLQGFSINSTCLGTAWRTDWPRGGGPAPCTSHDFLQFSGVLPHTMITIALSQFR